jgi:MOSC domain-containing protein YiiM
MSAYVHQINVSQGGVPKLPIAETRLTVLGLAGDKQKHTKVHGGPERAVCLFSLEIIERLRQEGHPIDAGTTGENLTIAGLDWSAIQPGVKLQVGDEAILEITRDTTPCRFIAASFTDGKFERILEKNHPGESRFYAKVIREGTLRKGQSVNILG